MDVIESQSKDKNKSIAGEEWDRWSQATQIPQNLKNIEEMMDVESAEWDFEEEDSDDYTEWCKAIDSPEYTKADVASWTKYHLYIPSMGLERPHFKTERLNFEAPPEKIPDIEAHRATSQVLLKLDYAEGIDQREMPPWTKPFTYTISPGGGVFLPNFMAFFANRDNTEETHRRARKAGLAAAQAYFRLLDLCMPGRYPNGTAFVGTIESNAEVVVGTVYWLVRSLEDKDDVKFRDRVLFRHVLTDIAEEDFLLCREQARQFRGYFCQMREEVWTQLFEVNDTEYSLRPEDLEYLGHAGRDAFGPDATNLAGPSNSAGTSNHAGPSNNAGTSNAAGPPIYAGALTYAGSSGYAGPSSFAGHSTYVGSSGNAGPSNYTSSSSPAGPSNHAGSSSHAHAGPSYTRNTCPLANNYYY